jgi:hypothetical protein
MSSVPVHSVHIYDEHSSLIKRLCGVVSSGLKIGNSVLIVATAHHRNELVKELSDAGTEVPQYAREGLFSMYDAQETLDTFMVNGMPDRKLFLHSVGCMLGPAKKNARSKDSGLTVFGEMVAVLWEQGEKQGALALEDLWNDLPCPFPRAWSARGGNGL